MLGLNRKESRVFRFSLVAHGFVALVCAVFGFLPSCEEEKEVHVFELASASPFPADLPPVQPPQPPTPPKPTPPKVVEPKPTPPKVVEPKPTPPKVVRPKPAPQKPKPTPPKVTPKPTPPKPTPPPLVTVSFDQFKKDHKLPDPPTRKPNPTPAPRVDRIDSSRFSLPAPTLGDNPSPSTVPPSVLNAYLSQVQSKLDRVWKRLQESTDLGFGGEARLSFRVSSNGTILSARLSKRSGNKALDDLVMRVSRMVGNVGPPPGGKLDSSLEIPFLVN